MTKRPRLYTTVLVTLSVLTLAFIFIQSLLPPTVSGEESGRIAAWLGALFGEDSVIGRFLVEHVRKIAHFTEFAVLGVEGMLLLRTYATRVTHLTHTVAPLGGFAVGFVDESLQIFSGRGPMIADVWIDAAGFAVGYIVTLAVLLVCAHVRMSRKENDPQDTASDHT